MVVIAEKPNLKDCFWLLSSFKFFQSSPGYHVVVLFPHSLSVSLMLFVSVSDVVVVSSRSSPPIVLKSFLSDFRNREMRQK